MPKLIIIGNYPPDQQQSMERYALQLEQGARDSGIDATIWRPKPKLVKANSSTTTGIAKWLGYIDKWILYPRWLRKEVKKIARSGESSECRFHIADHSNAYYLNALRKEQTVITCHDVLAIRGARGDADAFCPASRMGKVLQAWILSNLCRAPKIAAVSETTLLQLEALANNHSRVLPKEKRDWRVVLNALNADFFPMDKAQANELLKSFGLSSDQPFLLHMGSALPRKNRTMLLKMVAAEPKSFTGKICFAGAPMNEELEELAKELGLTARIIEVTRPSHEVLQALYSTCYAFVYPSFSEGFGWPLIEAQACGAPVIASNRQPMGEVSADTALHADPEDPSAFARALETLSDTDLRTKLVDGGLRNARRFRPSIMIKQILEMHRLHTVSNDV